MSLMRVSVINMMYNVLTRMKLRFYVLDACGVFLLFFSLSFFSQNDSQQLAWYLCTLSFNYCYSIVQLQPNYIECNIVAFISSKVHFVATVYYYWPVCSICKHSSIVQTVSDVSFMALIDKLCINDGNYFCVIIGIFFFFFRISRFYILSKFLLQQNNVVDFMLKFRPQNVAHRFLYANYWPIVV